MIVGAATGLLVALVLWVFLFAQTVDVAPPRYPSFEAAEPVAVDAGGRHRWPGTTVRVLDVGLERKAVERRWLGIRESVVEVQQTPAGWDVGSPEAGTGRALQGILACGLPGLGVGWLIWRRMRRRA